jgi:lysophospholipase L1-like esterase
MYKSMVIFSFLFFFPSKEIRVTENVGPDLATLAHGKFFFGHQSVGDNIVQGVRELIQSNGVEGPRIVRLEQNALPSGFFLSETHIGRNEDPASKCADFLKRTLAFPEDSLDIALMKFCHVDFDDNPNVTGVFELYRRTVDSLRQARPHILIVHCTVPLTDRTPYWKRFIRSLLGRSDSRDIGNSRRKEYNDILRQHYASEPIFDIATCESTKPDGSRSYFTSDGKTIYTLASEYTDDGGHLNRLGREVAATEFVKVLAQALKSKSQPTSANKK